MLKLLNQGKIIFKEGQIHKLFFWNHTNYSKEMESNQSFM